MKYIVILGDGMADRPLEALGGKTPLEVAVIPNINYFAKRGRVGMCKTVPDGFKPGSDVANMSVMGYPPQDFYTGRSPIEALSMGIDLGADDLALRCNLVTLSDEKHYSDKKMIDYSAGEISTDEAKTLIEFISNELADDIFNFYAGISYRHCLVIRGGKLGSILTPPHDISDKGIAEYLPKGENAKTLLSLMEKSFDLLQNHPINKKRVENGLRPANCVWFWGEGTKPNFTNFKTTFGLNGAVISAVDLVKGLGVGANMKICEVENATGTLHTNFIGKAKACIDALKDGSDYVYLHMEAPDECGHQGDLDGKIKSIELIDKIVVDYIKREMESWGQPYRVLIMPDHPTPIATKTHNSDPVPFALYDSEKAYEGCEYNEKTAQTSGIYFDSAKELVKEFLGGNTMSEENNKDVEKDLTVGETTDETVVEDIVIEEVSEENVEDVATDKAEAEAQSETIEVAEAQSETIEVAEEVASEDESSVTEEVATDDTDNQTSKGKKHKKDKKAKTEKTVLAEGEETAKAEETVPAEKAEETATMPVEKPVKVKKTREEKKAEKAARTPEQKKKDKIKNIIIVSLIAIVLITLSIVLPIVIINAGKIFVSKAEDFQKTKGNLYVLNKDISVDSLTLNGNYSLDLNKKTLTINGDLTIESGINNVYIGTKKSGKITQTGNLVVNGNIIVKGAGEGSFTSNVPITASGMDIVAPSVKLSSSITCPSIKITSGNCTIDGAIDGSVDVENTKITIASSISQNLTLIGGTEAYLMDTSTVGGTVLLKQDTKLFTRAKTEMIKGFVGEDGLLATGTYVKLDDGANAPYIEGISQLDIYLGYCEFGTIINCPNIVYLEKLATPAELTIVDELGQITCKTTVVNNAKYYIFSIDGTELAPQTTNTINITKYVEQPGNHTISVYVKGEAEGRFLDSDIVSTNFEYTKKLGTPDNIEILSKDDKFFIEFNSVLLADKYIVYINGKELNFDKQNSVTKQSFDISEFIATPNNYSIRIYAKSANENFATSNAGVISHVVKAKIDPVVITGAINGDNIDLSWTASNYSRIFSVQVIRGNQTITLGVTTNSSISLHKSLLQDGDKIIVVANGYDNYIQSEVSNSITIALPDFAIV